MRKYVSGTSWCFYRWTDVDSRYITRLHLIKTPWFAICLHWINLPDPEPYLHDHPVTFLSIVLRGCYTELRNHEWKARRWFNFMRATDCHRILYVLPGTLTLSLMGPKVRDWGFHTKTGWVMWKNYYAAQRQGVQL